jgi:potassium efflux system protein
MAHGAAACARPGRDCSHRNWSGGNPDIRRTVDVTVATGCDVRKASQILLDCAVANSAVLADPPPDVLLVDFGSSKLTLRLQYWVRLDSGGVGPEVDSRVRFAILDALASDNVEVTMV